MIKIMRKFWPFLCIFILMAFFSYSYWFKGMIPFPSDYLVTFFAPWQYFFGMPVKNAAMPDVVGQMYPWAHLINKLLRDGIVPLWNPYVFSGTPFLANYQSAIFHPLRFLYFILPEPDAWSIVILLQPLLAGFFTYLFVCQLGLSKPAALLSAISFMFCGFMTAWMAYGTMSFALLWLPLILFAVEKTFNRHSFFSLILISFSVSASLFSGHFQTSLYVLGAAILYLVFKLILTKKPAAFFYCLLFVFLGVMLSSVQLIPTFELYRLSVRGSHLNISEIVPWRYLITLFSPDFYGNPVTRNDWFGHYAEWSGFIGTTSLILATYIVFTFNKKPTAAFFALLGIFSLILTRPTPILDLIVKLKIPVLSSSAASRAICLFSFSASILAGYGWEKLKSDFKKKKLAYPLVVFSFCLLIFAAAWYRLLFIKPFEADQIEIAKRNLLLPTVMALSLWLAVLGYGLLLRIFKEKRFFTKIFPSLILVLIVLAVAFDVFRFARKWMPFTERKYLYPSLPVLEYLTKNTGHDRVFGYYSMAIQNYYGIQGFDGYDPLYIQRYGELLISAGDGKIGVPSTRGVGLERRGKYTMSLLNLMGGKYILHAIPDNHFSWAFPFWDYPKQFKLLYEDDKYQVYENLGAFPRAFIAYDYLIEKEPQKIINKLYSKDINLRETLVLEEGVDFDRKADSLIGAAKIISYTPNTVSIETGSDSPGLLLLSDNYYPGWKALVNGKETKIYRADYTFRAVEIPEGKSLVEFVYLPLSFRWGKGLSFLSLPVILFLGIMLPRLKKND